MAKDFVGLRLPSKLIAIIDQIANEETRTRANTVERILTLWLQEHRPDLLPQAEDKE